MCSSLIVVYLGQSWIPSQYGVSPECLLVTPSLSVDSVVQGLADSAGACDLSLEVSLDLVGQNGLGQVRAKDGSIAQDAVQLVGAAVGSTELDGSQLSLQVILQGVCRNFKCVAVVINSQQVTQPASNGPRDGRGLQQHSS